MDHSKEPWFDEETLIPSSTCRRIITGGPRGLPHIAYIPKNAYAAVREEAMANARRIIACVNACANIDTAVLERLRPGNLADILQADLDLRREQAERS